jgi:hypothetical protein
MQIAFVPKAMIYFKIMAGLLAYLTLFGLPISQLANSGKGLNKALKRLTAAGTAPDFNRIPIFIHSRYFWFGTKILLQR